MKQIRKRLTYANVMSSIAVFLVLGGAAAVAADQLGKNTVGTPQLKKNAVRTGKVGPEAIKAGKLAKNAVATNRLRDNSVTTAKIASGAILTDKLAGHAVVTDKIAPDSVTVGQLANGAVTSAKLANGAVTSAKLANGAVVAAKLGPIITVENTFNVGPENGLTNQTVQCPAGTVVLGGGVNIPGNQTMIRQSIKFENGWRGGARNNEATARILTVQAYCLGA